MEKFCMMVAEGKQLYQSWAEAGYSTNRNTMRNAVTRMMKDPRVQKRVQELQERRHSMEVQATAKAVERVALTKEWVLSKLIDNVERAMQVTPPSKEGGMYKYEGSVANRALELLGREMGMFVDRKEVGHAGEFAELDAGGVKQLIAQRLGLVRQSDGSFGISGDTGSGGEESS